MEAQRTEFFTGNRAAAEAAKLSRAQVVAAYPITPQTTIVEHISQFIADGEMNAQFVCVESEHSALSAVAGASAVGARTFTASCSQGLQLMSEVLYFTSGMRFPVVMAVANRTLSVPVNIWADHQDSMVNRDAGWLQLYAGNVQEVFDFIMVAYRVCEEESVSLPAMVCFDGFIISHVAEKLLIPAQQTIDGFLLPLGKPTRPILDPQNPLQFGEVLNPPWYPDFEYKKHMALRSSLGVLKEQFKTYGALTGRTYETVEPYQCEDAEVVLVGLGSLTSTAKWVVQKARERGERLGCLKINSFRPFPDDDVVAALRPASIVAVLDRSVCYGETGHLYPEIVLACLQAGLRPFVRDFVIGLGGKDITPETISSCIETARRAAEGKEGGFVFWPDAAKSEGRCSRR